MNHALYLLSLRIYEEVEINMRKEEALLNREGFYKGYINKCFGIIRSVSGVVYIVCKRSLSSSKTLRTTRLCG